MIAKTRLIGDFVKSSVRYGYFIFSCFITVEIPPCEKCISIDPPKRLHIKSFSVSMSSDNVIA